METAAQRAQLATTVAQWCPGQESNRAPVHLEIAFDHNASQRARVANYDWPMVPGAGIEPA